MNRQTVRQRLNIVGVKLVHFFYILEYCAELPGKFLNFAVGQIQPGEFGNLSYLLLINFLSHCVFPMQIKSEAEFAPL